MAIHGLSKFEKRQAERDKAKQLAQMQKDREKDRELYNSPEFNKLPAITDLIKALRIPNKIEVVEEEDFVIRSFLRHGSATKIISDLNEKYPDMNFIDKDIREFLVEYQEAMLKEVDMKKKSAVRRIMKTKEGLIHELLDLAELSKELAIKYDGLDDHSSAISAIKAAADIFYRNAKIEGILDDKTTININTQMDALVQSAASESSSFKDAVLKVVEKSKKDNTVDADFEDIDDA